MTFGYDPWGYDARFTQLVTGYAIKTITLNVVTTDTDVDVTTTLSSTTTQNSRITLEIDWDDGDGYHSMTSGTVASKTYADTGIYDIKVRAKLESFGHNPAITSMQFDVTVDPAGTLDDDYGSYDGSVASISRAEGVHWKALDFNGVSDYLTLPDYSITGAGNRTFAAWIKCTQDGPLFHLGDGTYWAVWVKDDVLKVDNNGTFSGSLHAETLTDGTWHHIVVTYNGTSAIGYVDGVQGNTVALTVATAGAANRLGRSGGNYYKGLIDEICIYNGAISLMSVRQLYEFQNPTDGYAYAENFLGIKTIAEYIKILERSADPPEPGEGESVLWLSDGSGKGNDGDVMVAAKAGGTTKYGTLFVYSTGSAW